MKMSKLERDDFVLNNHEEMTGQQLAETTGWSLTTIKSVKRRLGLVKGGLYDRVKKAAEENPDLTATEVAHNLGSKPDNVRDIFKALGISRVTKEDHAFGRLQDTIEGKFTISREDYVNTKTRAPFKCIVCGYESMLRPNDVITKDKSCVRCEEAIDGRSYVYVIGLRKDALNENSLYKIGKSDVPDRRLKQLKADEPEEYVDAHIAAQFPVESHEVFRVERELHNIFKDSQVYGPHRIFEGSTEIFETTYFSIEHEILTLLRFIRTNTL